MTMTFKPFLLASVSLGFVAFANTAQAGGYDTAADYNTPVGLTSAQENTPVNSSLRDANGNLAVVNGQITSAFGGAGGVQNATSSIGGVGGVGMIGTSSAIGNQLNVVTAGSNNIVIVSANQTNNGDQTANTTIDGN